MTAGAPARAAGLCPVVAIEALRVPQAGGASRRAPT